MTGAGIDIPARPAAHVQEKSDFFKCSLSTSTKPNFKNCGKSHLNVSTVFTVQNIT